MTTDARQLDHNRDGIITVVGDVSKYSGRLGETYEVAPATEGEIAGVALLMLEMEAVMVPPPLDDVLIVKTEACVWCAALKWPTDDLPTLTQKMMACRNTGGSCPWNP